MIFKPLKPQILQAISYCIQENYLPEEDAFLLDLWTKETEVSAEFFVDSDGSDFECVVYFASDGSSILEDCSLSFSVDELFESTVDDVTNANGIINEEYSEKLLRLADSLDKHSKRIRDAVKHSNDQASRAISEADLLK